MSVGILYFPGTNCEHDLVVASKLVADVDAKLISYRERQLPENIKLLFVPGGFSFGDYLRTGAMAKVTPVMKAVKKYADAGGVVVGICNGFQILCEAGLLPGVLLPNRTTRFLSRTVYLKVDNSNTVITSSLNKGEVFKVPMAHFEGNYFAPDSVIEELEKNNQVILRYSSAEGDIDPENSDWNPNGSINAIAGICNSAGNVFGFMPHPERSLDTPIGVRHKHDGLKMTKALFGVLGKEFATGVAA